MPDILHNLTIQSSAENVYDAIEFDNNKNHLCYLYSSFSINVTFTSIPILIVIVLSILFLCYIYSYYHSCFYLYSYL